MAMAKARMKSVPFYKQKFARSKYLSAGDPIEIREGDLTRMHNWVEILEEKKAMWLDSKAVVDQKNKKREYMVEYPEKPTRLEDNRLAMSIEILHTDRRGIKFSLAATDEETLNRNFWPTVEWLIAYFFAPRLKKPPELPVPDPGQDEGSVALLTDTINRFVHGKH